MAFILVQLIYSEKIGNKILAGLVNNFCCLTYHLVLKIPLQKMIK